MTKDFFKLSKKAQPVIFCRLSPGKKADLIRMVKKHMGKDIVTCAVGDGSNDVSMLREANVGIAILGKEGKEAMMASEFCIKKFKHLKKLILAHGRWSYWRLSRFIMFYFYKNWMLLTATVIYQYFCGYSFEMFFPNTHLMLFNFLFTLLPTFVVWALDQDGSY